MKTLSFTKKLVSFSLYLFAMNAFADSHVLIADYDYSAPDVYKQSLQTTGDVLHLSDDQINLSEQQTTVAMLPSDADKREISEACWMIDQAYHDREHLSVNPVIYGAEEFMTLVKQLVDEKVVLVMHTPRSFKEIFSRRYYWIGTTHDINNLLLGLTFTKGMDKASHWLQSISNDDVVIKKQVWKQVNRYLTNTEKLERHMKKVVRTSDDRLKNREYDIRFVSVKPCE